MESGAIIDETVVKATYEPTDSSSDDDKTTLCAIFLIVLTAILVVLILNIYTRWYFNRRAEVSQNRRHRRRQQHQHQHVFATTNTTAAPNRGLDPGVLNSIPIFTYSESSEDETSTEHCQECAVCLCEFEEGEKGRTLPGCNHSFHVECIDMWFHSHSTCPLCRACVESAGMGDRDRDRDRDHDHDQFVVEMMMPADQSPFSGSVEEDVAKLSWSGLLSAGNFLRLYYGNDHRNNLGGEHRGSATITSTVV